MEKMMKMPITDPFIYNYAPTVRHFEDYLDTANISTPPRLAGFLLVGLCEGTSWTAEQAATIAIDHYSTLSAYEWERIQEVTTQYMGEYSGNNQYLASHYLRLYKMY